MIAWLLKSIGISDELTSKLDHVQWLWSRPQMLWLGLLLMLPASALIVWRHRTSLPHVAPWARNALSICRIGVLLLLVVVLAGPYLRLQEQITSKPGLAVLLDESASMDLPAGPFHDRQVGALAQAAGVQGDGPAPQRTALEKLTRLQLAQAVLQQQRDPVLAALEQRFDIKQYRIARQSRPGDAVEPLSAADAAQTNLGGSIEQVLVDMSSRQMAGLVLLSDGRATAGPDAAAVMRQHARSGRTVGIPVFAVPVGSDAPPVDVAIADVLAPAQVSVGDTVQALVTIDSQGLDGRQVMVELIDAQNQVLDSSALKLDSRERQQVQLAHEPREPGGLLLSARVSDLPMEAVHANNRRSFDLRVEGGKLKVLYLEGSPRWDFRFLDHALRRDHGVEVTLLMQASLESDQAGEEAIIAAGMPQDADGFAEFDLVLLGDVSPALLTPRRQEQLAQAVRDKGVGLIVQAGPSAMPGLYAMSPLAALLPVKLEADGSMPVDGVESPAFAPFVMRITAAGTLHRVFTIYDNSGENRRVWDHMSAFHWAAATGEAKPGANVLATFSSPGLGGGELRPLISEQFAGRGRVLFIGTDSTFRWRRNVGSQLFYRFWGQAIRHVVPQADRQGESSWLAVHPARIEPDEPVALELYAVDPQGQALGDSEVRLHVSGADMVDQITLAATAQPGLYRSTWRPPQVGVYRLSYTDARGKANVSTVEVTASDRELRRPIVDRDALAELAEATGGELVELHQLPRLLDLIEGEQRTVTRTQEQEVWDNWLTLLLLVGLYCTDVGLRRMMGLS